MEGSTGQGRRFISTPLSEEFDSQESDVIFDSQESDVVGDDAEMPIVANIPVEKDARYYNMNQTRSGMAIIFNHEEFDIRDEENIRLSPRKGTNVDRDALEETFKALGFDVVVYNDLKYAELIDVVNKAVDSGHSDCDCIIVVILSHGDENELYARDMPYRPENIWEPFEGNKCPSLAGKPKLFVVNACRGKKFDKGVLLGSEHSKCDDTPAEGIIAHDSNEIILTTKEPYKIPSAADFYIAYSSPPGYYSWRNNEKGTWFIQSFCSKMGKYATVVDIHEWMTYVRQDVAINQESSTENPKTNKAKQVPYACSTLTRLLIFNKKCPSLS